MKKSILIVGGYGTVGQHLAPHLRRIGFDGRIVLAGRHPERGEKLAQDFDAELAEIDITNCGSVEAAVSGNDLVLCPCKDPYDYVLDAARQSQAAMVAITHSADTVSAPLFRHRASGASSAYVTAGHWQAGMAMHVARHLLRDFEQVGSIAITALFDPADAAGPMAREDSGEYTSNVLLRREGQFVWVDAKDNVRTVQKNDGTQVQAMPMGLLDVLSLAAQTNAPEVRIDIAIGQSAGSQSGGSPSHDIIFELTGTDKRSDVHSVKKMISANAGQAHLTALGIALAAEALLEDPDTAQRGGWVLPEAIVTPERAMAACREAGVNFVKAPESQLVLRD